MNLSHPLVEQLKKLNKAERNQLFNLLAEWQKLSEADKGKLKELNPYLAEILHNFSHILKVKIDE